MLLDARATVVDGGSGDPVLIAIRCKGDENSLTDCQQTDAVLPSTSCLRHQNDAGVICTSKSFFTIHRKPC